MKAENLNDADPVLRQTLRAWQVKEPLPPRFQDQVWHRIARQEAQAPTGLWSQVASWVNQALTRPSLAVGYLTVLLALGLLAGYWHARIDRAHATEELGQRYVQMMDPYR